MTLLACESWSASKHSIYEWKPQKRSINSIKSHRTAGESFSVCSPTVSESRVAFNETIDHFRLAHRFTGILNELDWVINWKALTEHCSNVATSDWSSDFGASAMTSLNYDKWMNEWMKSSFSSPCVHPVDLSSFKLKIAIIISFDLSPPSLTLY